MDQYLARADTYYQLLLVKEKSELLMQIEELNEVKEQVRGNLTVWSFEWLISIHY